MSSLGITIRAAEDAHGAGTMIDAHVATPSWRAENTPTLAA